MSAINLILLDTNVYVDLYSGIREGHRDALRLVNLARTCDTNLLFSAPSAKDVYYLVAADLKRLSRAENGGVLTEQAAAAANEMAWGCVSNMIEIATVVGCDQSDMWLAQRHKHVHHDFEDDLVIAAALRSKADFIVTKDERFARHSPVKAYSVADAIARLEAELDSATAPAPAPA